jgi:hypothetical protein
MKNSDRWDPLNRMVTPPGGRVGAWFNVVICGALCIGVPIVAVLNVHPIVTGIVVAAVVFGIAVFMETQFVRILLRQNRAARK